MKTVIFTLVFFFSLSLSAQNVGINNTSPNRPLTVQGTGTNSEWIQLKDNTGTNQWHLNYLGSGLNFVESGVLDGRLYLQDGGNVGIGTTSPNAKLQVNGDVRLGSSGQLFAAGGQENLRIIRGFIDLNGNVGSGTGFTVTQIAQGAYQIVYSMPFNSNDIPVVMVTPNNYNLNHTVFNSTPSSFTLFLQLATNQQPPPFLGSFFFVVYGVD